MNTSQPVILPASPGDSTTVTAPSTPLNTFNVAPNLNQGAILQGPKAVTPTPLNPVILTPPPTVKSPSPMPSPPKRKRQRIHFVNYLDDDESVQKRRSRRLKSQSHPYKYAKKRRKLKINNYNKKKTRESPVKIKTEFISWFSCNFVIFISNLCVLSLLTSNKVS